ncbi:hypothetical protein FRB96_008470 [Tulasnella sp. 330]|nr:hypothetical protein FRB96_008470 [Tulasnella sp. 330]KAG8883992.1 hypothetical protein FRB97_005436 [Tulasnella sp. 331]KAG8889317.1 hypothetical protein FRB98_004934 [Tulasnella sp. 332]
MGVPGLSTYLQEHHRTLSTTVSFGPETRSKLDTRSLVVDGWAFIYKILYDSINPWVYGGEYEAFAQDIALVIKAWEHLGIRPCFVFDGASPAIKFPEMVKRLQENRVFPANIFFRTSTGRRNEPTFLHEHRIIPPLVYGTCVATLTELGVPCIWADGEGDQKCVEIAASLGCWVLSNDTDFTILNAAGYAGFAQMSEMLWEVQAEAVFPAIPKPVVDAEDGWTPAVAPRSKGRNSRRPTTDDGKTCVRGRLLPPPGSVISLKLTVYSPTTLSTHFRIPTPFLPLFASLVGNDFTPDSYSNRFFYRGSSSGQRIERVSEILRSTLSGPRKLQSRGTSLTKSAELSSSASATPAKPDVPTLIKTAIKALCVREHSAAEVEGMANTIIDSILQYGAESSRNGPFISSRRRNSSPTHRLFQDEVNAKYTEAYRCGEFHPKVLDLVVTGTTWTNLFLENPDVQTCARTVGWDVLTWICAVLNDGIPIGTTEDEEQDLASDRGRTASSIADNEDDDDELIDVIEEQTDSEVGGDDDGGKLQKANRSTWTGGVEIGGREEEEEEDDDDDDPYYESYVDGVPPSLLTSALRRLRHERYLQGDASQDQTPTSRGSPLSPSGGSTSAVSPRGIRSPRLSQLHSSSFKIPAFAKPAFVTAYLRSGQRIVPFRVQVQNLQTLLASTASSRARVASAKGQIQTHARTDSWTGPIQLQPLETRLHVFLCAMQGNTSPIRSMINSNEQLGGRDMTEEAYWAILVLALRWTVMQTAKRAAATMQQTDDQWRWKQSEAKAFLRSCIASFQMNDSESTGPSRIPNVTRSPSSPMDTLFSQAGFPFLLTGQSSEAKPRAIQLTAQILVAIESAQHLAQVLLLSDALQLSCVERKFSGKRFHEFLGSASPEDAMVEDDQQPFKRLWSAVTDDGPIEWWAAEEINAHEKIADKAGPKNQGKAGPARKPVNKVQPGRLWSTLASLKD